MNCVTNISMITVLTQLHFFIEVSQNLVVLLLTHVVCHGIPSEKILKEGDIVNVDVTAIKNGWHGDTSRTFEIGEVSVKAKKLVKKQLMKP